jgi:hypothetical protein
MIYPTIVNSPLRDCHSSRSRRAHDQEKIIQLTIKKASSPPDFFFINLSTQDGAH